MKKIISMLVLVSVLVGCIVLPAGAGRTFVPGDVNGDGELNGFDSNLLSRIVSGKS